MAVLLKIEDWILEGYKEVPAQQACTSAPQQWDKPRGSKIEPEPVSTMVIAKPGTTNRKKRPLIANFDDNRLVFINKILKPICSLVSQQWNINIVASIYGKQCGPRSDAA